MKLSPEDRRIVYEYMRDKGYPRLTIKILLGYQPDGMDRLTVFLGKGSDYDYKLLKDDKYRISELRYFLKQSKKLL
jgi:hypothetical protein